MSGSVVTPNVSAPPDGFDEVVRPSNYSRPPAGFDEVISPQKAGQSTPPEGFDDVVPSVERGHTAEAIKALSPEEVQDAVRAAGGDKNRAMSDLSQRVRDQQKLAHTPGSVQSISDMQGASPAAILDRENGTSTLPTQGGGNIATPMGDQKTFQEQSGLSPEAYVAGVTPEIMRAAGGDEKRAIAQASHRTADDTEAAIANDPFSSVNPGEHPIDYAAQRTLGGIVSGASLGTVNPIEGTIREPMGTPERVAAPMQEGQTFTASLQKLREAMADSENRPSQFSGRGGHHEPVKASDVNIPDVDTTKLATEAAKMVGQVPLYEAGSQGVSAGVGAAFDAAAPAKSIAIMGSGPSAELINAMSRKQLAERMASQIITGAGYGVATSEPGQRVQAAVSGAAMGGGFGAAHEALGVVAKSISELRGADRYNALDQLHKELTEYFYRQQKAVTPDGEIISVTTREKASAVAAKVINDNMDQFKTAGQARKVAKGVAETNKPVEGEYVETPTKQVEKPAKTSKTAKTVQFDNFDISSSNNVSRGTIDAQAIENITTVGSGKDQVVEESKATVDNQMEALKRKDVPVVFIPAGSKYRPDVPEGFSVVGVDKQFPGGGLYFYDSSQVTAKEIRNAAKAGTHGELLGHLQSKADIAKAKSTVIVQATAANGTPIQDSEVDASKPAVIEAQKQVMAERHPEAEIQVKPTDEVIKERLAENGETPVVNSSNEREKQEVANTNKELTTQTPAESTKTPALSKGSKVTLQDGGQEITGTVEHANGLSVRVRGENGKKYVRGPKSVKLVESQGEEGVRNSEEKVRKGEESATSGLTKEQLASHEALKSAQVTKETGVERATKEPTVYIARHGDTDLNANGGQSAERFRGWKNVPLNEKGRAAAKELGAILKEHPITHILSSDLDRAHDTAKAIAEISGRDIKITPTEELRPWNLGELTGKDVQANLARIKHFVEHPDEAVPGGESYNHFLDRWKGVLEKAKAEAVEGKKPLIVAHARQMLSTPHLISEGKSAIPPKGGPDPGSAIALHKSGEGFELAGGEQPKFKNASTQIDIAKNSALGHAHSEAVKNIPEEHLGGKGREESGHITLRYGLKDDSPEAIAKLKEAVSKIPAFDVPVGKTGIFPVSEYSEGTNPAIAHLEVTPELKALRKAVEAAGDFKEDTFGEYKPHITLGYIKPEHSAEYKSGSHLEGQKVHVNEIVVSKRDGSKEALKLSQDPIEVKKANVSTVAQGERIAGEDGKKTQLSLPSGKIDATYRLVESASLKPSHNSFTFAKNSEYPEGVQERAYDTSKEAQNRVIQQGQNYDPAYTVNTNPDAVNGPPVITPDGIVLGGNSRAMSTQRLYRERGQVYLDYLKEHASQFGITAEQIDGMNQPVLVREIEAPRSIDELRKLGSELNKSMTGAMGTSEKAVSAGRAVKQATLAKIGDMQDAIGQDATLRDVMRERGSDIIKALIEDGVITDRERPQFVDTATGGLSDDGKNFVEKALLGAVVDSAHLMDTVPKSVLNKLEGSLADISSVSGREDAYNLTPILREALRDHAEIAVKGTSVDLYLGQTGMFAPARNPAIDSLIKLLAGKAGEVRGAFREFVQDAKADVQGQASLLAVQPSPEDAFNHAFGTDFTTDQYRDALLDALKRQESGYGQTEENHAADEGVRKDAISATRPSTPPGAREDRSGKQEAAVKPKPSRGLAHDLSPDDRVVVSGDKPGKIVGTYAKGAYSVKVKLDSGETKVFLGKDIQRGEKESQPALSKEAEKILKSLEKQKSKLLKAPRLSLSPDELKEFFTAGKIVDGYAGLDRVIAFHPAEGDGRWSVDVQRVDKNGEVENGERVRNHATMPGVKEISTFRKEEIADLDKQIEALRNGESEAALSREEPENALAYKKDIANSSSTYAAPSEGDTLPPTLIMNQDARDAIQKAMGDKFEGVNIDTAMAEKLRDSLADMAKDHPVLKPIVDQITQALKDEKRSQGINFVTDYGKPNLLFPVLAHETIHSFQRTLGGGDVAKAVTRPSDLLKGEVGDRMRGYLMSKGYKNLSDGMVTAEIYTMAQTRQPSLFQAFTEDELADFAADYEDQIHDVHGMDGIKLLCDPRVVRMEIRNFAKYQEKNQGKLGAANDQTRTAELRAGNGNPGKSLPGRPEGRAPSGSESGIQRARPQDSAVAAGSEPAFARQQPGFAARRAAANAANSALAKLYDQDIKPTLDKIGQGLAETVKFGIRTFYPSIENTSWLGRVTGTGVPKEAMDAVMELKGERERTMAQYDLIMDKVEKFFDKQSEETRVDFVHRIQTGQKQPNQTLQDLADKVFTPVMRDMRENERNYKVDLQDRENYFPNRWETPPGGEDKGKGQFSSGRRPLQGSKSFMKQQKYTLKEGMEAGGEPISTNPVRILRQRMMESTMYTSARQMWKDLQEMGLRKFFKKGQQIPEGWSKIDDGIAKVYFPAQSGEGMIEGGTWAAEANAARIINNYLSQDNIRKYWIGRTLMGIKNVATAFELGLSPYHAVFETIEAASSQMSTGILRLYNQGIRGADPEAFVQGMKEIATSPLAPVQMAREGAALPAYIAARQALNANLPSDKAGFMKALSDFREVRKDKRVKALLKQYPDLDLMVDDYFTGGGTIGQHRDFKTQTIRSIRESWTSGNYIGSVLRAVPNAGQTIMKPLFEHYIPNLKYSLFLRQYSQQLAEQAADIESGKITRAQIARDVVKSVDNRFGEMNFDNLFWNRTGKSILQMVFRSATWRLGSAREVIGALGGQTRELVKWGEKLMGGGSGGKLPPRGTKAPEGADEEPEGQQEAREPDSKVNLPRLDMRAAWMLSLMAYTAVIGTVFSKIFAGKYPWQFDEDGDSEAEKMRKTYLNTVHPRTGEADYRGNPVRVTMPTYWKDVERASGSPGSYLAGGFSTILGKTVEIAENKDSFGNYVYDPTAPFWQRQKEKAKYGFPMPFTVSNYLKGREEGNTKSAVLATLGLPKAPSNLDFTPAQKRMTEMLQARRTPETPQQVQDYKDRQERIRNGTATPQEMHKALKAEDLTFNERMFKHLTYAEAKEVYDKYATEAEREALRPLLQRKRVAAMQHNREKVEEVDAVTQ